MRMIFVNLPVKDLEASRRFYAGLGFVQNHQFSDETAISMVIEQNIAVMLLTEPKFRQFVTGGIADTSKDKAALLCISADSRAEVDALREKALANGGSAWMPPQDHGVMYGVSFQDPDGHVWEVMWMDPAVIQPGPGVAATEMA